MFDLVDLFDRFRLWLRAVLFNRRLDREMREEVSAHLARSTDDWVSRGLTPDEARAAARRKFGHVESIHEAGRDARGVRGLGRDRRTDPLRVPIWGAGDRSADRRRGRHRGRVVCGDRSRAPRGPGQPGRGPAPGLTPAVGLDAIAELEPYESLSTTIGSTDAARRAGTMPAATPTSASTTATVANTSGSRGDV